MGLIAGFCTVAYSSGRTSDGICYRRRRLIDSLYHFTILQLKLLMDTSFDVWLDILIDALEHYDSPTLLPIDVFSVDTLAHKISYPQQERSFVQRFPQAQMPRSHGGSSNCRVKSCTNKARTKGVCFKHGGGRLCIVPQCDRLSAQKNGRCPRHPDPL